MFQNSPELLLNTPMRTSPTYIRNVKHKSNIIPRLEAKAGISKNNKYLIATSGGVDSMVLAHLMHEYAPGQVTAITIDHKLRQGSSDEALFVNETLSRVGIPHHIGTLQWESIPTKGVQEICRKKRYDAIQAYAKSCDVDYVCVGHHADDQVENFFIRLSHYSGTLGLRSMPYINDSLDVPILRPLLEVDKEQLIDIAESCGIPWVEDPSNKNLVHRRNEIRSVLEEKVYGSVEKEAIFDVIDTFNDYNGHLEAYLDDIEKGCMSKRDKVSIETNTFHGIPSVYLQKQLLKRVIFRLTKEIIASKTLDLAIKSLSAWHNLPNGIKKSAELKGKLFLTQKNGLITLEVLSDFTLSRYNLKIKRTTK